MCLSTGSLTQSSSVLYNGTVYGIIVLDVVHFPYFPANSSYVVQDLATRPQSPALGSESQQNLGFHIWVASSLGRTAVPKTTRFTPPPSGQITNQSTTTVSAP